MKKRISIVFLLVLLMSLLGTPALAAEYNMTCAVEGGNLYFDSYSGTIVGCDDTVTVAEIPNEIGGVAVNYLAPHSFSNCDNLRSVYIPGSVLEIGNSAFWDCWGLKSVYIEPGVEVIGYSAFQHCDRLEEITIPYSVVDIGSYVITVITGIEGNSDSLTIYGYSNSLAETLGYVFVPIGKAQTVTFDFDGGRTTDGSTGWILGIESGDALEDYSESYLPTPYKAGYKLAGWVVQDGNSAPAGLTNRIASSEKIWDADLPITEDMTLTAKWIIPSVVTFNYNGGTDSAGKKSSSYEANTGELITTYPSPVREDYKFTGWFSDYACTTPWQTNYPVTKSITLYAGWNAEAISIIFDFNGGSLDGEPSVMVFDQKGATITEYDYPAPIKKGYKIDGWYSDSACTSKWTSLTFDESVTLYAKWIESSVALPSLNNFSPVNEYQAGQFTDVAQQAWYSGNVGTAFRLGLMKGNSPTTFNVTGKVTVAEAITMASRLHSIFYTGSESFVHDGGVWYSIYAEYAANNGITTHDYDSYTRAITRAEFAELFYRAFPPDALPSINQVEDNAIPDVPMPHANAAEIYGLYRAGILTGSDDQGTFLPGSTISRTESAAIVTRMADVSLRKNITLTGKAVSPASPKNLFIDMSALLSLRKEAEIKTALGIDRNDNPYRAEAEYADWIVYDGMFWIPASSATNYQYMYYEQSGVSMAGSELNGIEMIGLSPQINFSNIFSDKTEAEREAVLNTNVARIFSLFGIGLGSQRTVAEKALGLPLTEQDGMCIYLSPIGGYLVFLEYDSNLVYAITVCGEQYVKESTGMTIDEVIALSAFAH